ncbi:DUF5047 domain-containing protein [Streptomycetaceae bacterium NBC_01309]
MRSGTPQFFEAIKKSYTLAIAVEVTDSDDVSVVSNLPIKGGSVTVDAGSEVRYTASVTVSDIMYLPKVPSDPLSPYGNRIRIRRGIRYQNGTFERIPVGVYVIDQPGGDMDFGPVTVALKGLESILQRNKLTAPYSTAGATNHVDAITQLVTEVMPTQTIDSTGVTGDQATATKTWDLDADRWAACRELAAAIGCEAFFDAEGLLVIRDFPPAPADSIPVWEIAGGDTGVRIGGELSMSLSGIYNGVRCMSDGNGVDGTLPVSGQAVDDDPASPTRWGGPIGHVLKVVKSPLYADSTQCESAAAAMLPSVLGPNRTLSLKTFVNPALECGDPVRVVFGDGSAEMHTVQAITMPLSASGEFLVSTRSGAEEVAP